MRYGSKTWFIRHHYSHHSKVLLIFRVCFIVVWKNKWEKIWLTWTRDKHADFFEYCTQYCNCWLLQKRYHKNDKRKRQCSLGGADIYWCVAMHLTNEIFLMNPHMEFWIMLHLGLVNQRVFRFKQLRSESL